MSSEVLISLNKVLKSKKNKPEDSSVPTLPLSTKNIQLYTDLEALVKSNTKKQVLSNI